MNTLGIILLAACVSVGNAQSGGEEMDMPAPGRGGMQSGWGRGDGAPGGERLKELLNLSDETADKIEKLGVEHRKSRIALRAKLDAARVDFRALMREENPDENLAMKKQKEMAGIREELQTSGLAHRFAVSKLLTPEQRKILRDHRGGMGGPDGRAGAARLGRMRGFRDGDGGCCADGRPMRDKRGLRRHRMLYDE